MLQILIASFKLHFASFMILKDWPNMNDEIKLALTRGHTDYFSSIFLVSLAYELYRRI